MILSIVCILILAAVAFVNYVQGLFSATLSAILTVIAAAVAVGYTDTVVNAMKPGKFADVATGAILCCLFVVSYLILRVLFDKLVPGNVRYQATLDKIGAGAMGLVAGAFTAGIIALATESMPLGASALGYARYTLLGDQDATGEYKKGETAMDRKVVDAVKSVAFNPKEQEKLLVPVDDWVVGTVGALSSGALSGPEPFAAVHPDYVQELFGQRIGMEPGAKHTANNFPANTPQVSVEGVYVLPNYPDAKDAEVAVVRKSQPKALAEYYQKLKQDRDALVVVRADVESDASDAKNNLLQFSPGSVRLVVPPLREGDPYRNVFPIGTLEDGKLYQNRVDDYLFAQGGQKNTIDFVFAIEDPKAILTTEAADPKSGKKGVAVKDGVLFEMKRLARVDLAGQTAVASYPKPSENPGVMRKPMVKPPPPKKEG